MDPQDWEVIPTADPREPGWGLYNAEAERVVLAGLMHETAKSYRALHALGVTADDLYFDQHRAVWDGVLDCFNAVEGDTTPAAVARRLAATARHWTGYGYGLWLTDLTEVYEAYTCGQWVEAAAGLVVKPLAERRAMAHRLTAAARDLRDNVAPPAELLGRLAGVA